jgi:hypothetical protein
MSRNEFAQSQKAALADLEYKNRQLISRESDLMKLKNQLDVDKKEHDEKVRRLKAAVGA